MNTRCFLSALTLLGILSASAALAAPVGTAKAIGDYRPFWQSNWHTTAAHRMAPRRHYAATYATIPPSTAAPVQAMTATPAPANQVAQAPSDGRRFSYEPAPTPTAQAAPAAAAPIQSAAAPTQSYRYASPRRATNRSAERWSMQKTNPLKYTTH